MNIKVTQLVEALIDDELLTAIEPKEGESKMNDIIKIKKWS